MLPFQFYNLVHIVGLVLLMVALGGMLFTSGVAAGSSRVSRRTAAIIHGVGIFLILLGGFGMLARLGIVRGTSWPGWVWVKMGVWVTLGAIAFLPYRFPAAVRPLLVLIPLLAGLAAYMAIYKPL
jgi:hypothetical protein